MLWSSVNLWWTPVTGAWPHAVCLRQRPHLAYTLDFPPLQNHNLQMSFPITFVYFHNFASFDNWWKLHMALFFSSPERFPLIPHSMKLFRRIQKLAWTCYPCYRCVVIQSGLWYLLIIIWLWLKVGVISFSKLILCEKFDKQFKKWNNFHKLCVSA